MNLNSISRRLSAGAERKGPDNNPNCREDFLKSFSQSPEADEVPKKVTHKKEKTTLVSDSYEYMKSSISASLLESGRVGLSGVVETEVKHITYSQSDYVTISITDGYCMKAQVDVEKGKVYVEQKNEDGTVSAYEVDMNQISEHTENPIEITAQGAWNKVKAPVLLNPLKASDTENSIGGISVKGCYINDAGNIYIGRYGDACSMALQNGGQWSDYYTPSETNPQGASVRIILHTGRSVEIDLDRLDDAFNLKDVLSLTEYAELVNTIKNIKKQMSGSDLANMSEEDWEKLMEKVDMEIDRMKDSAKESAEKRSEQLKKKEKESYGESQLK